MAHALVERVTGRPADVPEPVALNLVMSDQAFPRVGPQFGRPAWQSHPVAYSLPMASLHEQQSCCWIADKAAPLEAEYSWRGGRIPDRALFLQRGLLVACPPGSTAGSSSRRWCAFGVGMVTLLVLLR